MSWVGRWLRCTSRPGGSHEASPEEVVGSEHINIWVRSILIYNLWKVSFFLYQELIFKSTIAPPWHSNLLVKNSFGRHNKKKKKHTLSGKGKQVLSEAFGRVRNYSTILLQSWMATTTMNYERFQSDKGRAPEHELSLAFSTLSSQRKALTRLHKHLQLDFKYLSSFNSRL